MAAPMITLTEAAAERAKALLAKSGKPVEGLRIGVRTRGCSGLSYFVEYADAPKRFEDVVEDKGVRIFIDPASVMFVLGTVMDYVQDKLQSGFVFINPNEKSRCGCGESFNV
ncbi:MAG: iron-sulfur cluster assembly accessory protein [Gammaproteobacteria bacterium]|nr:iron-sulfur cluster assembly accessory protein [Gammaproteobacteria bacterium]